MCTSARPFLSIALARCRVHEPLDLHLRLTCTNGGRPRNTQWERTKDCAEVSSPGRMISAKPSAGPGQWTGATLRWSITRGYLDKPVKGKTYQTSVTTCQLTPGVSCDYVCICMCFCRLAAGFAFVSTWSKLLFLHSVRNRDPWLHEGVINLRLFVLLACKWCLILLLFVFSISLGQL